MTEYERTLDEIILNIKRLNVKCAQMAVTMQQLEETTEQLEYVRDVVSTVLSSQTIKELKEDQSLLHKRFNNMVERLDNIKKLMENLSGRSIPAKLAKEIEEDDSSLRFSLLELD